MRRCGDEKLRCGDAGCGDAEMSHRLLYLSKASFSFLHVSFSVSPHLPSPHLRISASRFPRLRRWCCQHKNSE